MAHQPLRPAIEAALLRPSPWPFAPALEATYQTHTGRLRRHHLARTLFIIGPIMTAALALDLMVGRDVFLLALPARFAVAGFSVGAGMMMPRLSRPWEETALFGIVAIATMITTLALGEYAPPRFADRYMMAASTAVAAIIAASPLLMSQSLSLAIAAAGAYPVAFAQIQGVLPLTGNWDLPAFNAGALGVAVLIARRNEITRREGFLRTLHDEITAARASAMKAELLRLSTADARWPAQRSKQVLF